MAWEPGIRTSQPAPASGFTVNNQDRNDVVAFWHAVYQASEGYQSRIKWTGNYSGNSGTTSAAFVDDVERRLNYFRAMCGVPSDARVNSGSGVSVDFFDLFKPSLSVSKAAAAQSAALMISANFNASSGTNPALSHNPAKTVKYWSPATWNANAKGNLAFGVYGPGAITEYMLERHSSNSATSAWNSLVGHRRWNLYPASTDFATGDQPGTSAYNPPTNVFYVIQRDTEFRAVAAPKFIAYPAAGYFPAQINSPYWSLSRQGANFSGANVRMTDAAGKVVPLLSVKRSNDFGDPAIIWEVSSAIAATNVYSDTRYNVTVSGITTALGATSVVPSSYSYSVFLINPNRLLDSQTLAGVSKMSAKASSAFLFTPPSRAESVQVVTSVRSSKAWTETGETTAKSKVLDYTDSSYPLVTKMASIPGFGIVSGKSAFRLTFPTGYDLIKRGVPEQSFELDRDIIPKAKAKLTFSFRRGYMTKTSQLAIEISNNDGLTWSALGAPIKGISDTQYDIKATVFKRTIAKSSAPVRIRFRYFTNGGSIYTHEAAKTSPTGIFLDDITVTNSDWLEPKKITTLAGTSNRFTFSSGSAGTKLVKGTQWNLRLRTKLGGKWFARGAPKAVSITAP